MKVVIDIHSGGREAVFPLCTSFHRLPDAAQFAEIAKAARLFDTPFLFVYSRQMSSGLLTDEAEDDGKIAIGGEFGSGELVSPEGVQHAYEGSLNVMREYGLLPGPVRPSTRKQRLIQAPDLDDYRPCPRDGIWEALAVPGEEVAQGQLLGRLHDFSDHTAPALEIRAHRAGVLIARYAAAVCPKGLTLFVIGEETEFPRMKITNVEVLVLKSPGLYRSPEADEEAIGPTYMGLVKVTTDAGIVGYSDMETSAPVAKAAVEAPRWSEPGMECFEGLASLLVGENPLEVERLWYKMYRGSIYYGRRGVAIQAISAIDIALWDICGKFYGQPVCVLMGARWHEKIRAYASTLFRPTPDAMRAATQRYLDQGFTAIKFGWGVFGEDPRRDVELVAAARQTMGDRNDLLVDTGWFVDRTPKQAINVVRSLEPYRPFFIEEILNPEDYDGYRTVAEAVTTPIACGEQEATEWGFRELIERAKVDILQPDLTRCGGLTVARKIVHMAERANIHVIPHSWSSDLLTAASLHLNAFQRRAVLIEFNTASGPLSRELGKDPIRLEDGYLRVPSGPGLGVEVNEEVIAKYRIA